MAGKNREEGRVSTDQKKTSADIYFLGRRDLEMQSIADLLQKAGIRFHDRNLDWRDARVSAYKDFFSTLSEEDIPVFVELYKDRELPSRAVCIDHHDDSAGWEQETALEAIARRVGVPADVRSETGQCQ